ncbi:MAG: PASTA domain-containing protein [bacterium]
MLIKYLSYYLIFLALTSLLVSYLVWHLKLPSPKVVISLIMAVILSPLLLGYLYLTYFTSIPETRIPVVIGLPSLEAEARLINLDLRVKFGGEIYDLRYPEGTVIKQRPEAGRKVKAGRLITLLVSSGKRKIIMPDLVSRLEEQAQAVITAKGLVVGQTTIEAATGFMGGVVMNQSPLPGEEIDVGSEVNLIISASKEVKAEEKEKEDKGGFWLW